MKSISTLILYLLLHHLLSMAYTLQAQTWEELDQSGVAAFEQGNWRMARAFWEQAKTQAEATQGVDSEAYIRSLNNLGLVNMRMSNQTKALDLFLEAHNLSKQTLETTHPENIVALSELLKIIRKDPKQVPQHRQLTILKEWKNAQKERLGEANPEYIAVCQEILALYLQSQSLDAALEIAQELDSIYLRAGLQESPEYEENRQTLEHTQSILTRRQEQAEARQKEYIDRLDGSPFMTMHYARQQANLTQGKVGVRLTDANGEAFVFETDYHPQPVAHSLSISPFGAIFNDVLFPPNSKQNAYLRNNSYAFWMMYINAIVLPANRAQDLGTVIFVELGADFGVRYNFSKRYYFETGIHIAPLGLYYHNLGTVLVSPTDFAEGSAFGEVADIVGYGGHVAVIPFLRTGFYFNQKKTSPFSIDFSVGYRQSWIYAHGVGGNLQLSPSEGREGIIDRFTKQDILINARTLRPRDIAINGLSYSLGLSFYFR